MMFLSLDLLSEYRIQHGAIGPLYVTSSYSAWIFCRGVSGFATDCPCGVWCRGLTTCLLHVGPPFGNRFLNNSWTLQSLTSQDVFVLEFLSEYRIQHGAIGPLYVTSGYSAWIFCRGVSGFATDCPCGVWCRGLTTCLLHVGPPFGNRFLNNSWAVSLT